MACHMCRGSQLMPLINFGAHPIAHHFVTDPSQPEYVHPVNLSLCEECGLLQLVDPIPPEMVYTDYVCLSSWKHQPHIPRLLQMVEQLPGLTKTSRIIEVGSNDGRFLQALRERGFQNVLGIEPAQDALKAARQVGVDTIGAYFTRATAEDIVARYGKFDLFIARQVLEHVTDLVDFRDAMSLVLAKGGFVLIEVPNAALNLTVPDYSLWEEHVNYFTLDTLLAFLAQGGIRDTHSETVLFSGEALIVVGKHSSSPLATPASYLNEIRAQAIAYRDQWPEFRERFIDYLRKCKEAGGRVAVYGAGARCCSLINFINIGPYIEFVVDDQPEKQGRYMPGSHIPIVPADELERRSISLCLLAVNTESEDKVLAKHPAFQRNQQSILSILPPSNRLLPIWKA